MGAVNSKKEQEMSTREEKTQPDQETEKIRLLLADLEERVRGIEHFERDEVIQAYCDDLESQVIFSYDSAIKSLNEQRDRQLEIIGSYRRMLLVPSDFNQMRQDRTESKIASLANANSIKIKQAKQATPNLTELTRQLDELKRAMMSEQKGDVDSIQTQLNGMKTRITDLKKHKREEAFFGVFARFKVNRLFDLQCNQVGVMSFGSEEKALDLSKGRTTEFKLELKHSLSIGRRQVHFTFLPDGSLITTGEIKNIFMKIDLQDGLISNQVKFGPSGVGSMVLLRDNHLALGHMSGKITIWNLTTMKQVRAFHNHDHDTTRRCFVFSLLVLPNGNLVSACKEHKIIIWDPFLDAPHCQLFTLNENMNCCLLSYLGLLSNGYLVISAKVADVGRIEVWDVENGDLVREIPTGIDTITDLLVLSNDQVVIGTVHGMHKVFDVIERALVSSWTITGDNIHVAGIVQLPYDMLLLPCRVDSKPSAQIWDPFRGVHVQSIAVDHPSGRLWAKVSPDLKTLVTSSEDGIIKVWSMSYPCV